MKRLILILLFVIPSVLFGVQKTGLITAFQVYPKGNLSFRVQVNETWFYLEEGDSNYKSYQSMLMYADVMDYSVVITSTGENVDGYHKISHIYIYS